MTVVDERTPITTRGPAASRLVVAFGPEAPGWGSWDWVGSDLGRAMSGDFTTQIFHAWQEPEADGVVVIKHALPPDWVEHVARRSALIFAPVDFYSGIVAIDADASLLRHCNRVLVHCDRLRRYFKPYARVESLDHHVKFAAPMRSEYRTEGNIL